MGEDVQKVTLPFDEDAIQDTSPATDGALALSWADAGDATAEAVAARLADYAQAWGISVPADFAPATMAQVAYWRELCGALVVTGKLGMQDSDWPTDLAPSKPTLRAMAERKLIVRRRRAWHLKLKWHARLQYLRLTAVPTPALTIADGPAPGLPTYAELQVWEAICRWLDRQPQCRARLPMIDIAEVGDAPARRSSPCARGSSCDTAATVPGRSPHAGRRSCLSSGTESPKRRESDHRMQVVSRLYSPSPPALTRGISTGSIP